MVRSISSGILTYRIATAADLPGISHVRTSVVENLLTRAQLDERGISNASVAASFERGSRGWVAEQAGQIAGFSIADSDEAAIFALFVLPEHEGRGIGGRLFALAVGWLWENGTPRAWLHTGPKTRAAAFYERRGWVANGTVASGDVVYECRRPVDWNGLAESRRSS